MLKLKPKHGIVPAIIFAVCLIDTPRFIIERGYTEVERIAASAAIAIGIPVAAVAGVAALFAFIVLLGWLVEYIRRLCIGGYNKVIQHYQKRRV